MQIKVGLGITTYNRPEYLKECIYNILKYSSTKTLVYFDDKTIIYNNWDREQIGDSFKKVIKIYTATDTDEDRRGIAYRKNECLRALKDCDYVFLLDDDCFPIKEGWIDFFINSGEEHLLYLDKRFHNHKECLIIMKPDEIKKSEVYSFTAEGSTDFKGIDIYRDCGGVFMFMTKSAIDRVGAFNEKFETYGFEHAEYSNRILGKSNNYPCLCGTDKYIFAHDYSTPNHKSSITDEEKNKHVKNNWDKYFKEPIKYIHLQL